MFRDLSYIIRSMTKLNPTRRALGFTLIELLVVIAIIGILSAVVLAALNSARDKGNYASVKEDLAHVRAQAELDYDAHSCYSTTATCGTLSVAACPTDSATNPNTVFGDAKVVDMINTATKAGGTFSSCVQVKSTTGVSSYAIAVQSPNNANAWCVDSSGNSKEETPTANSQAGLNGTLTITTSKATCK